MSDTRKELIDRVALKDDLSTFAPKEYTGLIKLIIRNQPAVDIVRSEKCAFGTYWEAFTGVKVVSCRLDNLNPVLRKPDDFCSYGERSAGE